MKEIRRNWKILVGIFICAIGIMLNGNREAFAGDNEFETIVDVNNPKNFSGSFTVEKKVSYGSYQYYYYTYKVTPDETGVYKIYGETTKPENVNYYRIYIYAYNAKKQAISSMAGISEESDKLRVEANIYMVKGKTYYIGYTTCNLMGQNVDVTMSKTNIDAQPKMEYTFQLSTNSSEKEPIKGSYNWDSENATLTFENCEIGPCLLVFYAGNNDKPIGERYYFSVDDFPDVKNIKIVFKGENKCKLRPNQAMIRVMEGTGANSTLVNVGIEFTGGGTVDIDEECEFRFIDVMGDIIFNDITFNIDWEEASTFGSRAFSTESNLMILNSTINAKVSSNAPIFKADWGIVVDDSSIFINAVWGKDYNKYWCSGIFSTNEKVLLNSGELWVNADEDYIRLLEENNYCSFETPAEGIVINKDKFTIISGKDIMDLSKYKYSLENTSYIYDSKEKTPKVTIEGLVEGKHFEVEYSDNVNVGKAKFKVTGIGIFTGTIEGTFDIVEDPANKKADEDTEAETTLTDGKLIYKILKDASADGKKAGKVEVIGLKKKNLKKITVKSVVKFNGKKYKVTSIAANAFKGNKKITKVTIGKNVRSIGKKAFFGCKKLKSVKIKSKKLKVGKKAFYRKGGKKLTIKVPKKLKKKYKKAFKKAKTNKYVVK